MGERLIVIGGTAAGLSAASKAKKLNPQIEIIVFEKSGYISYGACGLPYFVGGMISDEQELIAVDAETMRNKRNISIFIHHEVTSLHRREKFVEVKNLDDGFSKKYPYDKLVIATGAIPIIPQLKGVEAPNVYYLRNVEDGIHLKNAVNSKEKQAVIIGGGFIGLELAEQLTMAGKKVHIFEAMPRLLPFLDETYSDIIKTTLKTHGVEVHLGVKVKELITKEQKVIGVKTNNNEIFTTDFVVMSVGVLPATKLAKEAGLQVGMKDGIVVDENMQTSDKAIWACGDCVQMRNLVTGLPVYIPLGTTANKQGRIAGENIGGGCGKFKGVLGSMVTKVFELYIAATGLSLEQAKAAGIEAVASLTIKGDKASYYPGRNDSMLCLISDKKTGRLVGAQGIGSETIAGRINVFATAITCKMTISQISELDLVYAPPVAPVYDPILIAAAQAIKEIEK
jgi:NADPH-dependent 2,4-dienoyl-CoA reductase/sulfur reductase-like enzyme